MPNKKLWPELPIPEAASWKLWRSAAGQSSSLFRRYFTLLFMKISKNNKIISSSFLIKNSQKDILGCFPYFWYGYHPSLAPFYFDWNRKGLPIFTSEPSIATVTNNNLLRWPSHSRIATLPLFVFMWMHTIDWYNNSPNGQPMTTRKYCPHLALFHFWQSFQNLLWFDHWVFPSLSAQQCIFYQTFKLVLI